MKTNTRTAPGRDDFFTGAKTPEYAVFYNIAFFKIAGFINFLKNKNFESDKMKLEGIINSVIGSPSLLTDSHYLKLRNYLWKGYSADKNASVTKLTTTDKENIIGLIKLLRNIRNFQSHVWHDNKALIIENKLKLFIEELHDLAKLNQIEKYNREVKEHETSIKNSKLFEEHEHKWYISQSGRNFFLSFFLTNGEMNLFMKQRKGCKRDDKPEFKIKHAIYTYYTHREAATHNHYGFEETTLSEMPADYIKDIMNERQAYKIINYLNDVPNEVIDIRLFPLFLKDKTPVLIANEYIQFINEHGFLSNVPFSLLYDDDERAYERIIQATYNNVNFRLRCNDLHKIILNIIRGREEENAVCQKLEMFIKERNILITMVEKGFDSYKISDEPDAVEYTLEEFYSSKLRANDTIKVLFGKWMNNMERLRTHITAEHNSLLSELKGAAIELTFYDFYYERNEKPRPEKYFMEFAVQYLVDHNIVPHWEWQVEKLNQDETDNDIAENNQTNGDNEFLKPRPEFHKTIPKGYRLVLRDNQLLVKYNGMFFQLGHRAIKNLLIAHFEGKEIDYFFVNMVNDIAKIKECAEKGIHFNYADLKILFPNALPRYMKQIMGDSSVKLTNFELMAMAKERLAYIIGELESFKKGEKRLNRAEKNRQIMRCYKYFDWKYTNDAKFKFLRKDEYKQLSIYHYCLDKTEYERKKLYKTLVNDIEKHMPEEVNCLLKLSESFNDLFEKIVDYTIEHLTKWQNRIPSMKPEKLKECYAKLGFSGMLTADSTKASKVNKTLMGRLPFDVHPILVLKVYYAKELEANNDNFSLSSLARENSLFTKGLKELNYNYQNYLHLFSGTKNDNKIIGDMNTLKTEDALLWRAAKEYLKKVNVKVQKFDINNLEVRNYRDTDFPIRLNKIDGKEVTIVVPFHQLNDFMFVESRPVLQNIAAQLLRRSLHDEKLRQRLFPGNEEIIKIPYVELVTEMKRIFHQSLKWAQLLFEWEAIEIKKIAEGVKENKVLSPTDGFPRFAFKEVCEKAALPNEIAELLTNVRNKAMHSDIPVTWTYEEMQQNDKIKNLLNFTNKTFEKRHFFN